MQHFLLRAYAARKQKAIEVLALAVVPSMLGTVNLYSCYAEVYPSTMQSCQAQPDGAQFVQLSHTCATPQYNSST